MVNELKVYNCFGELTLHLRHSLGQNAELLTIDGTDDMQAAVAELRGNDFDRTIAKGGELVRLTASWGSEQYLPVLARYFGMNFGWRTQTIQTKEQASPAREPSEALLTRLVSLSSVEGNLEQPVLDFRQLISGNGTMLFTDVSEYRPESEPRIEFHPVPETIPVPERAIYGIPAR